MEWLKISLERLLGFLAALIPGAAVLLLFILHYPELAARVWQLDYLGYQTKVVLSVFCMFLAGWTISTAFNSLLHAIGGAIGGFIGSGSGQEPKFKPWHNANWRSLLSGYF